MSTIGGSTSVRCWSIRRAARWCLAICAAAGMASSSNCATATLVLSGVPTMNVTPGQQVTFEIDVSATPSDQNSPIGAVQVYLETPYNSGAPLATFTGTTAPTNYPYIFSPSGFVSGGGVFLYNSTTDTSTSGIYNAVAYSDFYNSNTFTGVTLGGNGNPLGNPVGGTVGLETLTLQVAANAPIGSQIPLTFVDYSVGPPSGNGEPNGFGTAFTDNNGNNELAYAPANNVSAYNPANPNAAGTLTVVPEPCTLLLTVLAAVGFAWLSRRRQVVAT